MTVRIPTRFEMLLTNASLDPAPLIVEVKGDLASFERLRRTMDVQQGGALAFLFGRSGVGKTTAVYSLAALAATRYEAVFLVPATIPLRELGDWLNAKLPKATSKTLPILIDNREATDDTVGLRQLMSSLNAIVRQRPDAMFLWPTTDAGWRAELREVAISVGGRSLVPDKGDIEIEGPALSQWPGILERLLIQLDQSTDDLALSDDAVADCAKGATEVGAFLENVRDQVAQRLDDIRVDLALPSLLFVITSGAGVVGEANRLRRARKLNLKADELLSYSPKSAAGKYWKARLNDPNHHLAYILTLFDARLVTMGPSAVTHSVLEGGDAALKKLATDAGAIKNSGNASRTFKSTDLFKFLTGTTEYELTSSSKGAVSAEMRTAYGQIQALSSKKHKVINQAISAQAQKNVPAFRADLARFEVDLGDANAFADAVVPHGDEDYHIEFHHLSEAHCKAASMASYIMDKLQGYALHYNLIPR